MHIAPSVRDDKASINAQYSSKSYSGKYESVDPYNVKGKEAHAWRGRFVR